MPAKRKTTRDVFDECQNSVYNHVKLISSLKKTYEQTVDKDEFRQEFLQHVKYALAVFKREPAVERILEFAAKFASSVDEEAACSADEGTPDTTSTSTEEPEKLLSYLFNYLLKVQGARDRAVRFRVCQMINKLLNCMGDDADIDDDLYNGIYDGMLIRLRDTIPVVRVQAVLALARLQNPEDADCPVIAAYIYLLEGDLSYEVRRAVLTSIAPSAKTLPFILATTRDVKESVRKVAFQILSEKVHIRALTIAQRVKVLKEGLSDRSESVREACATKMLQSWLRAFDGNVLDLLKCLDVENSSEDTAELMLKVVFNKVSPAELVENFDLLDENHVIPTDKLTCEGALYWRRVSAFLKTQGSTGEILLDQLVPTVSAYCEYMQIFVKTLHLDVINEDEVEETLKKEFIAKQLLHIAGLLDLSDEVGRKRLDTTIHDMLVAPYIPSPLAKILVELFNRIHTDDEERITLMAEIIADTREPITTTEVEISDEEKRKKELKLAGIRMQLNETKDILEDLVAKQDFGKAAEYKSRLEELEMSKASLLEQSNVSMKETREEKQNKLKRYDVTLSQKQKGLDASTNDPATLVKCLTIASEMMQYLSVTGLNPTLRTLVDTLVLPSIQNQDPAVRNMAVNCIGLASLLCRPFACSQLLLLMQISQVDQETIKVTALEAIFDLLHLYGLEAFKVDTTTPATSDNDSDEDKTDEDEDQVEDKQGGKEQEENKSAANSVVTILSGLLESESSEIRTVAAEGMAKLLLAGRVSSPKLLRRLLILWYNPTTEEDLHLRHCLGAFFPVFAMAGRFQQECFQQAFLPTLQTLFEAPTTSPLASINENNVAELLVHLTDHRNLKSTEQATYEDSTVHDSLSLELCNEILEEPDSPGLRTLCKTLNTLQLSYSNQTLMKDLSVLANQMLQVVEEKVSKRQLEKFLLAVEKALSNAAPSDNTNDTTVAADSQEDEGANSQEDGVEEDDAKSEDQMTSQTQEVEKKEGEQEEEDKKEEVKKEGDKEDKPETKTKSPEPEKDQSLIEEKSTTKKKTRGTAKANEEELAERLALPQKSTRKNKAAAARKTSVASQKKSTFKTPSTTSTGRSTRASKKAAAPVPDCDSENGGLEMDSPDVVSVPMKRKTRKTKINLAQLLSDSESDAENVITTTATKNRSSRRQGGRSIRALVDLSNTDDSV